MKLHQAAPRGRRLVAAGIWALRIRLQLECRVRELALFDLRIDSKLRGLARAAASWQYPGLTIPATSRLPRQTALMLDVDRRPRAAGLRMRDASRSGREQRCLQQGSPRGVHSGAPTNPARRLCLCPSSRGRVGASSDTSSSNNAAVRCRKGVARR